MRKSKVPTPVIKVEIYSKEECHLCDIAISVLEKVREDIPFELIEVDIRQDPQMFETYKEQIPVVFINGRKSFKYKVDEQDLRKRLLRLRTTA